MRKILLSILVLFVCAISFGQRTAPTTLPSPNSAGYSKVGFYRADSAFLLGIRTDTNWHPIVPALSGVKFAGRDTTELYFFDGIKWKISGSGGGTSTKVDSVTEVGDSLFYWINGTDYFIGTVSGASTPYVDSIYIRSGENTDSLYYTKDGVEYNWGVLDVANGLIHGGNVTWTGTGFDFFVSAATYRINGTRYTSNDTTLTLTASDPTDPRIDVFKVTDAGVASFTTGTAASNPVTPQIDPDTEVFLTSILIPAASTTPTVDTTTVYDENIEWTGSAVGVTASFNNTGVGTVYRGSYSTNVNTLTNNDYVKYVAGSPVNVATKQGLAFFVKLKGAWLSAQNLRVRLYSSGVALGTEITIPLSKTSANWQGFTIPISNFALSSTTIDEVRFRFTGSGSASGIYLDWVYFQSGVTPPITTNYVESIRRSGDSVQQYINGSWQYAFTVSDKADKSTSMTAGDGLVGGGDLSTNRSFRVDTTQVANKIWVTDRIAEIPTLDTSSLSNRINSSYYDIEAIDSFSYVIQRPNATQDTIEIASIDVSGLDLSGKVSVPTVSGNLVYWPTIPESATLTSITLSGSAAVSQSGGELTMTGIGSVATSNIINIPIDMSIEEYTETISFRANKTTGTQRIGLGTRASNFRNSGGTAKAYSWTFDASSGADAGESFFFTGANGTFTQRDQTAALAFSNGDTIELTVRREGYTFYCKSKNVTTDDSLTLTYTYPVTSTSDPVLPPTSRPCIYQLNQANQVLLSWTVSNDAATNPYLMIIGDSKTAGYNTTTASDRFVSLLQTAHPDSVVAASGFGDETGDAIKWLNIIQRVRPQNLIIALGSNDVRNSVTDATIALNLTAIKNAADIVSCNVYFLGMNETSLNQSYLWQFANATFGIDRCILTYPALAGDGVHLTTAGHLTVKNAIDAILF